MVEADQREPIAVGAEGRFVLEHFAGTPRGPVTLRAECPGYRDAELSGVQWGVRDVELVVPRAPRVRVRVVDAAGAPVPGVSVRLGWRKYVDPESASKTDEEGIDVLPAESPGRQTVSLNWATVLREAAFVELDPADESPRDAVLEVADGQRCQILVRWGNGVPAADVKLELGLVPAALRVDPPASAAERFDRWVAIDSATTDAAGSAVVLGHPTARYVLRVDAPGRRVFFAECRIGTGLEPLVIELGASASVRGTLRPAPVVQQLRGLAADGSMVVEVQRDGTEGPPCAAARVEVDGSFSIPGVEPGDWQLRLHWVDRVDRGWGVWSEPLAVLTGLRDGETRDVLVDVAGLARTSLTGIVTVNGKTHVGAIKIKVERRGADGQVHAMGFQARTDARGRFRRAVPRGRCRVLAMVGETVGCLAWVPSDFVDAAAGRSAEIDFRIEAVAVDVVTVRADGVPVDAEWQVVGAQELTWNPYLAPGTTRTMLAPGRYQVSVRRAALLDQASFVAWVRARLDRGLRGDDLDLDVAAGEIIVPGGQARARVEIVLPEAAGY